MRPSNIGFLEQQIVGGSGGGLRVRSISPVSQVAQYSVPYEEENFIPVRMPVDAEIIDVDLTRDGRLIISALTYGDDSPQSLRHFMIVTQHQRFNSAATKYLGGTWVDDEIHYVFEILGAR